MKKNKLNRLLKFGLLLFGISFFIIACDKDDDLKSNAHGQNQVKSPYKISTIDKSEIENNEQLNKKLNKLTADIKKHKTDAQNKTVYSNEYEFYINTDYATYIENEDATYHSYTFPILRTIESDTLENLVLSLKEDGTYDTLLITYYTSAQEKQTIIDGLYVDLTNKVVGAFLDDENLINNIFSKTVAPGFCLVYDYGVGPCDAGSTYEHDPESILGGGLCSGSTTPIIGTSFDYDCIDGWADSGFSGGASNNSSGSTSNNNTNTNGQTSNTSNSNGNVITSPTPCNGDDCLEEFDPIHDENCEKLQDLLDVSPTAPNSTLKQVITSLKNDLGGTNEEGFVLRHTDSLETTFGAVHPIHRGEGFCKYLPFPIAYGGIHLHIDNTNTNLGRGKYIPMFSHGDLKNLLEFTETYNNPTNPPQSSLFVHMLVTNQGTYAIKIKDITKLQQLNTIWSNKRTLKRFKRLLDTRFGKHKDDNHNPNGTAEDYQKVLLKHINIKYDLGISLFKATETDGEPTGWEELTLQNGNTANSSILTKPCN